MRRCHPSKGELSNTCIGRQYFKQNPSEYFISRPVRFDVIRAGGNAAVRFKGVLPVAPLTGGLRGAMEQATRRMAPFSLALGLAIEEVKEEMLKS